MRLLATLRCLLDITFNVLKNIIFTNPFILEVPDFTSLTV